MNVRIELLPIPVDLARAGDSGLLSSELLSFAFGRVASLPSVWNYLASLRRLLERLSPDLVHSNGIKTHLATWLSELGTTARRPTIWHLHDYIGQRPIVGHLLQLAQSTCTTGVAVSRSVADDARRVMPQLPIRVVHNVVDPDAFAPGDVDPSLLDHLAGLPVPSVATTRVILVATYARWKGHDVFLRAAAHVADAAPNASIRFYIVGGPIYQTSGSQFSRSELLSLALELGVHDRVGFIGFQIDPANVYRAADIVVHASTKPEPFGLTIIEAMACGRATVIANKGGASELFNDGVDAVGTNPDDPLALAKVIHELATSSLKRTQLGIAARIRVKSRFNPAGLSESIVECYRAAGVSIENVA